MAKRNATKQLTKDNYEDEGDEQQEGSEGKVWAQASEETLAKRTFAKVKRKDQSGGAAAAPPAEAKLPTFNLAPQTASAPNPWAKFQVQGGWECGSCMLTNKPDVNKCISCEEPKPAGSKGAADEKGEKEGEGEEGEEGEGEEAKSDDKDKQPGFGFQASGFEFKAPTEFSFDGSNPFAGGFTWSAPAGGEATFGANGEGGEGYQIGSVGATSEMSEQFKDKTAEPSGEQDEEKIAKAHAKAYVLKTISDKKEGEEGGDEKASTGKEVTKFVESGEGEAHVNVTVTSVSPARARIVMRADKTQRLILNTPLFANIKLELQGERYIRYASVDDEAKPTVFLLKFKSQSDRESFHEGMTAAVARLQ